MNFSGAASIEEGSPMTATEVRQRQKVALEMMEKWQGDLVASLHSNALSVLQGSFEPDMSDIINRIQHDRVKLQMQNMTPKGIYLGHTEYRALHDSQEFNRAQMSQSPDKVLQFMGFAVYLVYTHEHYVMTGE